MRGHKVSRKPAKAGSPRPVFPFAATLRAVALIVEGDGRPALYICAESPTLPRLFRVPEGCRVTVYAPFPLPAAPQVGLPVGSAATFTAQDGRVSVLTLHTVRLCRELLEALESHAAALKAWEDARPHFGGERKGQGAA